MSQYNLEDLKKSGFLKHKERDLFSVRLRITGGYVTAQQLPKLAEVSKKYGRGHIHLTMRQGIEIPFVHFADLEKVREELAEVGLSIGACGPRVRTVTACQGDDCSHGLIPTQKLARKIDERFFGKGGLPHKFKIGVTGCPIACVKPTENDLGIMGVVEKEFIEERCNLCGLCEEVCPVGAISIEGGKLHYDPQKCIKCGECIFICPPEAWVIERTGFKVFLGGKMGRFPHLGHVAFDFVEGEERLIELIAKIIELYRRVGKKGERFADTVDRLGLNYWKEQINEASSG